MYHIILDRFDPESIVEAGSDAFRLLRVIDKMSREHDSKPKSAERLAELVGDPHVRDSDAYKRLREYHIIHEISSNERKKP